MSDPGEMNEPGEMNMPGEMSEMIETRIVDVVVVKGISFDEYLTLFQVRGVSQVRSVRQVR